MPSGAAPVPTAGVRLEPGQALAAGDDAQAGSTILARILATALEIVAADRGWIMLYDSTMDELYTTQSEGLGSRVLRIGVQDGVAGATFRTGELVNIARAYQEPRFNPAIDFQTGYRTRNLLCTPIFAGDTVMSGWMGWDNGLITPTTVPTQLAPVDQNWLQYPKWGQYLQTGGGAGEKPDVEFGQKLMALYDEWRGTTDAARQILGSRG